MFHFKQFVINQEACPMKINTDGVLLGAMVDLAGTKQILDIGTGTGVIALMMAQRNSGAQIDAIDIDAAAAERSKQNFENSLFRAQLKSYHHGFKEFFELYPHSKYDLIVSNPPYHLNALQSPKEKTNLSKHTTQQFFFDLLLASKSHLAKNGRLVMVLPVETSLMLQTTAKDFGLYPHHIVKIKSYPDKAHIRHVISFSLSDDEALSFSDFCIYDQQSVHSLQYKALLKDFFKIF